MSGSRVYNREIAEMAMPPCRTSGRVTPIAMKEEPSQRFRKVQPEEARQ
jgi:hypothetical protein